jgi:hypothetical protein
MTIKTASFIGAPGMPDVAYVHLFRDEVEESVRRAAQLGFDAVSVVYGDHALCDDQLSAANVVRQL